MMKTCPDCKTETLDELGTAGMMIGDEYHNRHDWRCITCFKRFEKNDCTCSGTCAANFKHHSKSVNSIIIDGREK